MGKGDEQQSLLPGALSGGGLNTNPADMPGPRSKFPNRVGSVKIAIFMRLQKLILIQSVFCVSEYCECVPPTPTIVGRWTWSMATSALEMKHLGSVLSYCPSVNCARAALACGLC